MGTKMTKLSEGITKQDVIDVLGNPDGFQLAGKFGALRCPNRLMSGWSWDRADYFAVLRMNISLSTAPVIFDKTNQMLCY